MYCRYLIDSKGNVQYTPAVIGKPTTLKGFHLVNQNIHHSTLTIYVTIVRSTFAAIIHHSVTYKIGSRLTMLLEDAFPD